MVYSKVIEWGHQNLRPKEVASSSQRPVNTQTSSKPTVEEEIERRKQAKFKVGDKIEIFSNTNKQWCKGEVIGVEGSEDGAMANCSYITSAGMEMSKKIAMGHQNLRFDDSVWPSGMDPAQAGPGPSEFQTQPLTEGE